MQIVYVALSCMRCATRPFGLSMVQKSHMVPIGKHGKLLTQQCINIAIEFIYIYVNIELVYRIFFFLQGEQSSSGFSGAATS